MRHFISLLDFTTEELTIILNRADYLEMAWKENKMPKSLLKRTVGLAPVNYLANDKIVDALNKKATGSNRHKY